MIRDPEYNDVLCDLESGMDTLTLQEFGDFEKLVLCRSLRKCNLEKLPEPTGDLDGQRCSGECVCEECGNLYYDHPMDWRVIGYGNVPFLNIICNGNRVKL